jgi:hypothetical protein
MRMWIPFEAVWLCYSFGGREGAPRPWPVLTLHGQPSCGDAGVRALGEALQVNTTLTTLE